MLAMKGAGRVSSTVWVGEKQLNGRISEVVLRNATVRVMSTVLGRGEVAQREYR